MLEETTDTETAPAGAFREERLAEADARAGNVDAPPSLDPKALESAFTDVLGQVLELDAVPVEQHFLDDLRADHTTLGVGCTLGVGAYIHYGATIGDGAVIAADSFLMKGEDVPPGARWGGHPATESRALERATTHEPPRAALGGHV